MRLKSQATNKCYLFLKYSKRCSPREPGHGEGAARGRAPPSVTTATTARGWRLLQPPLPADPLLPTQLHCLALWLSPHCSHPVPAPARAAGWGLWPVLVSSRGKKPPGKSLALSSPGGGRRVRHGGGGLSPRPRCFPGGMIRAGRAGAAATCPPQGDGIARRGGCSAEGETPGPVRCARCPVRDARCPMPGAECPVQGA